MTETAFPPMSETACSKCPCPGPGASRKPPYYQSKPEIKAALLLNPETALQLNPETALLLSNPETM
jgi:hypothetical protein